jgi:hypothetical protein
MALQSIIYNCRPWLVTELSQVCEVPMLQWAAAQAGLQRAASQAAADGHAASARQVGLQVLLLCRRAVDRQPAHPQRDRWGLGPHYRGHVVHC